MIHRPVPSEENKKNWVSGKKIIGCYWNPPPRICKSTKTNPTRHFGRWGSTLNSEGDQNGAYCKEAMKIQRPAAFLWVSRGVRQTSGRAEVVVILPLGRIFYFVFLLEAA